MLVQPFVSPSRKYYPTKEAGVDASYDDDIGTADERMLGRIVAEKYDTDFFIMDDIPCLSPFYTMQTQPTPSYPTPTIYLFVAKRLCLVHIIKLCAQARATDMGVPIATIQSYIDAFKHGANPHAGGGIGMERVVMLFLGLDDIRKSSMFPRDPTRLSLSETAAQHRIANSINITKISLSTTCSIKVFRSTYSISYFLGDAVTGTKRAGAARSSCWPPFRRSVPFSVATLLLHILAHE